ncbi:MAG: aminotransferase class I/II-fold pyridoxal phosphate-dependent enzyme [Clostridiaceae bacterium]
MQALMLAAGMGKRLGKYTDNNTKCMVEIAGKKLIDRALEAIRYAGINRFIVVIGYKGDQLREYLTSTAKDMELVFVENDDYEKTNNIYSLFLAREHLKKDDTIVLESDLIYQLDMIKKLADSEYRDAAMVAKYEQWMDGTVVFLDHENNITEFVEKKNFIHSRIEEYYKTVNIYKFSKEFSKRYYIPFLNAYIEAYGDNEYYELVLKAIAHLSKSELKGFKLENELWYEIDDAQDLDIAGTLFSEGADKLANFQKRYGGYWRFPKTKDFCYLVNPFFPTKGMCEKFKCNFNDLLAGYPSGMQVQRINAAKMFNVDQAQILVGNGAAELINGLEGVINGKVLLTVPVFNEYIRCFRSSEIVYIKAAEQSYQLDRDRILDQIDQADNVVIVNPDNPSGSFLKYSDMMDILDACRKKGKTVVVDESFMDFADMDLKYTLIDPEILAGYPNLIVIKSISKSYGVPGLRLGVLACGDNGKLDRIYRGMAVWNINSFAEYFFQIINLYQKEYQESCHRLAHERKYLMEELKKIPGIVPYDSQANYIMCRLEGITSKEAAIRLLCDHNIFIKELSGKEGFNEGEYVRIALRDSADNKLLIDALNIVLKSRQ